MFFHYFHMVTDKNFLHFIKHQKYFLEIVLVYIN